jgi:hypothetical protein
MYMEQVEFQGDRYKGQFIGFHLYSKDEVGKEYASRLEDNHMWVGIGRIFRPGTPEPLVFPFKTPHFDIDPSRLKKLSDNPFFDALVNYGQFGPYYFGDLYPRVCNNEAQAQINDLVLAQMSAEAQRLLLDTRKFEPVITQRLDPSSLIIRGLCISDQDYYRSRLDPKKS